MHIMLPGASHSPNFYKFKYYILNTLILTKSNLYLFFLFLIANCIYDVETLRELAFTDQENFKIIFPALGHQLKIKLKLNSHQANTEQFFFAQELEETSIEDSLK